MTGPTTLSDLICIGKILNAHGIRGQVKVRSFTEDPQTLSHYQEIMDDNRQLLDITLGSYKGDIVIASVEGVTDRNSAERLAGTGLYISRHALPTLEDGEFYRADLEHLQVIDNAGKRLGMVKALHNYGAGDIIEIQLRSGKTEMYPFDDATVPVIDLEKGFITLIPPEEIFVSTDE